jgi:cytochrome c553
MIHQILIVGGMAVVIGGAYTIHEANLYGSAPRAEQIAVKSAGEGAPGNFPQPPPPPPWAADLAHVNPADGQTEFASCAGCHGAQGAPARGAPFPRLAGLAAPYVAERLYAYRVGAGPAGNPMQGIAGALNPHTMAALAAYIATLPVPPSKPANGPAAIKYLDEFGDNARAIPACGACHGPSVEGVSPFIPALAGQTASYIVLRLSTWQEMSSPGPDDKVMAAIAKRLTPAEVKSLGDFYQQQ